MSTHRQFWTAAFYWLGVIMTLFYVALMLGGHTVMGYRLESARFPLMWPCAGLAIVAFIGAEVCTTAFSGESRTKPGPPAQRAKSGPVPQPGGTVNLPIAGH